LPARTSIVPIINAEPRFISTVHPKAAPLTAAHLGSAWQMANGDSVVNFRRVEELDDGKKRYTSVRVNYRGKDKSKPEIRIQVTVRK